METTKETVLVPHEVNNLQLLINPQTGEVFTSQSGLARLCGKARSTIAHFVAVGKLESFSLKAFIGANVRDVVVYGETTIAEALARYKPELLLQCTRAGLRVFLHGLVGLKYELRQEGQELLPGNSTPKAYKAAKYIKEIENLLGETQPKLTQYLIDHCINEVLGTLPSSPFLPPSEPAKEIEPSAPTGLMGVVEIAETLGLPVSFNNRSNLGKFVKKRLGHMAKTERRLCNGTMQEVHCYPNSELVQQVVRDFFRGK